MSRFTMTLTAAAASAVAAIAVVALPAVGADPKPSDQQAQAANISAFVACLSSHGLAGAPTDPADFKPWLGAKEASDPEAAKAAIKACDDKLPAKAPVEARGPDIEKIIACVQDQGLDAPTAPDAFKRWVIEKESSDPGALDTAMRACKLALAPGPSEGPPEGPPEGLGKPGACINEVRPADKPAADTAANGGI